MWLKKRRTENEEALGGGLRRMKRNKKNMKIAWSRRKIGGKGMKKREKDNQKEKKRIKLVFMSSSHLQAYCS
jgi:hypothetical protein